MTNAFNVRATWCRTTVFMITSNDISAAEKFSDAHENGGSEFGFVLFIKAPPILIGGENLFERDFLWKATVVQRNRSAHNIPWK